MLEIVEDGDILTVRALDHETFIMRQSGFLLGALVSAGIAVRLLVSGHGFLCFLLFILVGILISVASTGTTEMKINRDLQSIAVRRRGLFTYNFKVYSFDDFSALPAVSQVMTSAVIKYEFFVTTNAGEKVTLCDRQPDTDQLDVVANWLADALPKLPAERSESRVLKLNP